MVERVLASGALGVGLRAWGKRERDPSRPPYWLPLLDHCIDVATVMECLLQSSVVQRRLAGRELEPGHIARLCVLTGLHDLGKANLGFQAKADPEARVVGGHVGEALAWLFVDRDPFVRPEARSATSLDELSSWFSDGEAAALGMLVAAITHHGGPPSGGALHRAAWWRTEGGVDPVATVAALTGHLFVAFPMARRPAPLLDATPTFQHGFSGLVMLADWLGSNRSTFAYGPPNGMERVPAAREAARRLVAEMGFDLGVFRTALGGAIDPSRTTAPHPLRPIQQVMAEAPLPEAASVVVVESETGSGKTEAALIWFLRLFREGRVDGMYFAVPTRSAATQLHGRIVELLRRFAPQDAPPVVLAVPGYLQVDEVVGQRLAPFEVLWPDRTHARGWAAENSKRYLAGGVAVGTIDQALLSVLPVQHAHLRASALRRHLLVVDEVHASDAYMEGLLAGPAVPRPGEQRWGLLRQHMEVGGHALLLSATLGSRTRARLVGWRGGDVPNDERYPLVTLATSGQVDTWAPRAPGGKSVEMVVRTWSGDPAAIAERAANLAARGARVLVLRNTVRDAVGVQLALESLIGLDDPRLFRVGDTPAPHHARFAAPDRALLDRAVEAAYGKGAPGGPRVLVATQTVEQSLDIDADVLITDLCPIDVLLQRIGRVHRHAEREDRAAGFERAQVELLVPTEPLENLVSEKGDVHGLHGWGSVYDDLRMLQATWTMANRAEREGGWNIPEDNRELVEEGVDPDRLAALVLTLGGRWTSHEMVAIARELAHRRLATRIIERRDRPFVDEDLQWVRRSTEDPELLVTRLGERDIEVAFTPPFVSPFGARVTRLRVPFHMARGLLPPDTPLTCEQSGGRTRFVVQGAAFEYDRCGLNRTS